MCTYNWHQCITHNYKEGKHRMKKYLSMLIIVVLLFSLTACGNNNSYTYDSVSNNTNTDTGDEIGTVDPIPASEAFNTKSIWFGISDSRSFAKDSYIQVVFAFDGNGNVTVYNNVGLFEFSMINNNMSDDEILAIVKDIEMEAEGEEGNLRRTAITANQLTGTY